MLALTLMRYGHNSITDKRSTIKLIGFDSKLIIAPNCGVGFMPMVKRGGV